MLQNFAKPKGEILAILRDAETLEEVERWHQPNIILDMAFYQLMEVQGNFSMPDGTGEGSGQCIFPGGIAVTTRRMSPSRLNWKIPGGDSGIVDTTAWGNAIPNVASPQFFPTNGGTQQYGEWSTRIPVPGANMEINTIMLTDGNINSDYSAKNISQNGNVWTRVYAYSKLSSPCLQTTSQVLDVYYRIQFPTLTNQSAQYSQFIAEVMTGMYGGGQDRCLNSSAWTTPLPMPTIKTPDIPNIQYNGSFFGYSQIGAYNNGYTPVYNLYKVKFQRSLQQTDLNGLMIGAVPQLMSYGGLYAGASPYVTNYIQNVFGHTANSTISFLDIDGLPTGSGHFVPSGTWNYKNAPVNAGQYYSAAWPKMFNINITATGNVGASAYTYDKHPFFGYNSNAIANNNEWCTQARVELQAISCALPVGQEFPINTYSPAANPTLYTGLLGDLTQFGVEQMTSAVPYDATSIVIPKMNQILLYNMAASDYWYYNGAFTDITQVAVVNGIIYAGCRNTGLWEINPVTGTVTNVTAPAAGIDLSKVNGVCKGYNNSVWVLGNNGLVHYDGTSTWTLYNSTSTPALAMAGISDNANANWSNVGYIKANHSNANGEVLMVFKPNATANSTLLGCWWSLAGTATLTGTDQSMANPNTYGSPRTNRTHVACSPNQGVWVVQWNSDFFALIFGTTTVSSSLTTGVTNTGVDNGTYQSLNTVNFVQGPAGGDRLLHFRITNTNTGDAGPRAQVYLLKLDATGIDTSVTDSTTPPAAMTVFGYDRCNNMYVQTSNTYSGYGFRDMALTVHMGQGVLFNYMALYTNSGFGTSGNAVAVASLLYQFALSDNVSGTGPLSYIAKQSYGWNGSTWVLGNTTGKPTHSSVATLDEGLSLAFVDGSSGTSFTATEFYNFAVCFGRLKDNASTTSMEDNFYFKKAYIGATDVSTSTIPTSNAGATGLAGISAAKSNSTDTQLDSNNNTVFLDQNGLQYSVGAIDLIGNFNVTYSFDPTNTNMVNIEFGIGYACRGLLQYYFFIGTDNNLYISYPSSWTLANTATNVPMSSQQVMPAANVTSLGISRTGNQITFNVNGNPVSYNNTNAQPGTGMTRFNLLCSPTDVIPAALNVANRTCPAATVVSNGTDNAIIVGTSAGSTGYFNPLFGGVDYDARNGISATINGVAVTAIHVDGSAPGQGEITVDPWMGTIAFNAADQGKAYAQSCTYITHE